MSARVVKLVDTQDLKSCDHCDRAGSSPAPGTKKHLKKLRCFFCLEKLVLLLIAAYSKRCSKQ